MKKIPVINKSRKKDVKVTVIPSEAKDEVPTPPEDYKAEEDIWNDNLLEDLDTAIDLDEPIKVSDNSKSLTKKHLAEELASLEPSEMRQVIRAAKHLRKFVECISSEEDEFQEKINKIWEA